MKPNTRVKQKGGVSPRHNLRRPLYAFIAALSLILQLLVPLEQSWATSTLDFDIDTNDVFIICTPSGLRILSLNSEDEGQPIESSLDISCPACSLASVTIAPLPVSDPISRQYDIIGTKIWFDQSDPAFTLPTAPLPARGPPKEPLLTTHIVLLS
ncbi:MAG: hypothetical protein V7776_02900 [Halopseudomonas aestusnigri]